MELAASRRTAFATGLEHKRVQGIPKYQPGNNKAILKFASPALLISIFLLLGTNPLLAQWVQTDGPFGGSVSAITVSGKDIFAGSGLGGVFLSTDDGETWTEISNGLPSAYIAGLAASPNATGGMYVFAATNVGVFRSTNTGASWEAADTGLSNTNINTLCFFNGNLFAGRFDGVFMSYNAANWGLTGLKGIDVQCLVAYGGNLFAGTLDSGVYVSRYSPTYWTRTGLNGKYVYALTAPPNSGGTDMFAGTFGNGVYISADTGTTWTPVDAGLKDSTVQSLVISPSTVAGRTTIFAGTSSGVFLSANNGTSWSKSGLLDLGISALAVSQSTVGLGVGTVFAGTGNGVFMSTNNGGSWVQSGLTFASVNALASTFWAGLYAGGQSGGVFLTTDNGTGWANIWPVTVLEVSYNLCRFLYSKAPELISEAIFAVVDPVQDLPLRILRLWKDRVTVDA